MNCNSFVSSIVAYDDNDHSTDNGDDNGNVYTMDRKGDSVEGREGDV
jgi:hypothetical protein